MRKLLLVAVLAAAATPALGAETITYSYDVHGRLTKAVRSGGPSNNAQTEYKYDKAGNRVRATTTGAPS